MKYVCAIFIMTVMILLVLALDVWANCSIQTTVMPDGTMVTYNICCFPGGNCIITKM